MRLCNCPGPCHIAALPENSVNAPDRPSPPAHLARLILIVSLAPTVGLGIGRFAYSLVLPDMRDALGWSYSAAGFMNTVNAAGYLVGALVASRLVKRFGLAAAVRWGTLACVASLALCALSGNFVVLSFARLLAGLGAAAGFVAGIADATVAEFAIRPIAIYLAGYFLFGAGYIAYMTFMIAYIRDAGGGAAAQSAFWSLIGISAFVTPWVWHRVLAFDRGGVSTAIILGVNA